MRIDHVIYATNDLDGAAARVQAQIGVAAVGGGRHDGLGTHNRIVPLRDTYVELLAVCDEDEAAGSALGSALCTRIAHTGEGLMGWAAAVDDVQPIADRLGTEVVSIGRQGRTARLTGVLESLGEPYLPFFIARDLGGPRPDHGAETNAIEWLEVTGDAARLDWWLDGEALPVRICDGPPTIRAIGVGDRVLS